jgi:hypothetical protein
MKEIILTQGRVALVDDDMYEYLNTMKWQSQIRIGKKTKYPGLFNSEMDAATTYMVAYNVLVVGV